MALFLGMTAAPFGLAPASAATASLTSVADTYVVSGSTAVNGAKPTMAQSGAVNRAIVRFDATSLPAGSTVNSVTLKLYVTAGTSTASIRVHPENDGWNEATTTWGTQPAWNATVLATSAGAVTNSWLTIKLPVSSVTAGKATSFGFDVTPGGVVVTTASRESTNDPQLIVDYGSTGTTGTPPSATTGAASAISATSATVSGTANDNGTATTCRFDYGTTTAYGSQTTAQDVAAGSGPTALTGALTNLAPNTPYSYRLRCSSAAGSSSGANGTFTTAGSGSVRSVTKVIVVVEENHGYDQMLAGMPYLTGLARQYGYASNYRAIGHPSLPNYLAMAAGSTFGVTTDCGVSTCPQAGPTVFDQAIASGRTAKVYAEDMTSNCQTSGSGAGLYAVRHTAWPYFTDTSSRAHCTQFQVPSGTYQGGSLRADVVAGNLPNIAWLIPNLCNDAHDSGCPLSGADSWLSNMIPMIMTGPDWASGHLAIVITADEDNGTSTNKVLTVVAHPDLHSVVTAANLTTYGLTRFQEQVAGVSAYLNNAGTATDMAQAFGLTVGP
jgi:hypothetical protein